MVTVTAQQLALVLCGFESQRLLLLNAKQHKIKTTVKHGLPTGKGAAHKHRVILFESGKMLYGFFHNTSNPCNKLSTWLCVLAIVPVLAIFTTICSFLPVIGCLLLVS